jgi:hypothetical protein
MPTTALRTLRFTAYAAVPLLSAALVVPAIASGASSDVVVAAPAAPAAPAESSSGSGRLTGCLEDGVITKIKKGTKPSSPCGEGAKKVTWNVKGPRGEDGDRGPRGLPGAAGANGVSGYEIVTRTAITTGNPGPAQVLLADDAPVTVPCSAGKKPIGGGVQATTSDLGDGGSITASYPSPGGLVTPGTANGWTIVRDIPEGFVTAGDIYYAICITAA